MEHHLNRFKIIVTISDRPMIRIVEPKNTPIIINDSIEGEITVQEGEKLVLSCEHYDRKFQNL